MKSSSSQSLAEARELLSRRLTLASRAAVPSPPATRLLQRRGLEATIEQKFCSETYALLVNGSKKQPASILVVDISGTGRAATVWVGRLLELLAHDDLMDTRVTLAIPGTRWAGRGQLLTRYLEDASSRTELEAEILCGPATTKRSAPVDDEREAIREAFDLILILALSGSAGIGATWPTHPAQRWLEIADGAVMTFVDPDSIVGELPTYSLVDPSPVRLRVETLDTDDPRLVGRVDLDDVERAKVELPLLIESARRRPWRIVAEPPPGVAGSPLACLSEMSARKLIAPLELRRTLVAGSLRLVAGEGPDEVF